MERRTETQKAFADYLRKELKKPADWDEKLFGEFPGTVSMFQKYFIFLLEENKNQRKIKAIERQYNLEQYSTLERKKEAIQGRPRNIEKFFKENTVPYEKNLNFIALVFEAPVQTLEEYAKIQDDTDNKQISEKQKNTKKSKNTLEHLSALFRFNYMTKSELHSRAIFVLLAVMLFGVGSTLLAVDSDENARENEHVKAGENTERLQVNTFFPDYIADSLFIRSSQGAENTIAQNDSAGVFYHTTNIFNDKCIYKQGTWSFTTDSMGEDMNSNYGKPFNESIHSEHPVFEARKTIANQKMDIYFILKNQLNKQLFFSSFKVKILESYNANAENAKYNVYKLRGKDKHFKVVFDGKKSYGFTTDKKPIKSGGSLFAKLRIKGNSKCTGLIFRFRIISDCVDANGNHYKVKSDKDYLIGFVKP